MDTPFMNDVADGLAEKRVRVVRFEFPYIARRRETDRGGGPDRPAVLEASWLDVIGKQRTRKLLIGGKSMGGRIASMVADQAGVAGVVCLGYPFHPPGKPEKLRTEHLQDLQTPALIVQGQRDTFGTREEVDQYQLSPSIEFLWLEDGDHSFKPRKSSGFTLQQHLATAVEAIVEFGGKLF